MPSNLRIDPDRLWSALMETAAIGATAKGGINRQTLTMEDGAVRAWFKREAEALGCKVTVDEVGNMFALRPGRRADLAPIALGSHLDTQPTGGKFDGVLGVLGALEAMRTLVAAGYETNAPFMVVNWTNEEGARFAPAMLGSGVFAGVYSRAEADAVTDIAGVSFGERARRHRLARRGQVGRDQALGLLRAAHRAGADPGGGGQDHRRRHRRAGRALVRGGDRGPREPCRHHADAAARRRAGRLRPHRRRGARHRARACADRGRHGGARGGEAQLAQRGAGRGDDDRRSAPPRRRCAAGDGNRDVCGHRARGGGGEGRDRDQEAARHRRRALRSGVRGGRAGGGGDAWATRTATSSPAPATMPCTCPTSRPRP